MVLTGGLSNHPFKDLLQCLTRSASHKDRPKRKKSSGGWPDGRRKFGTVSSAVVAVLAQADREMRVGEIHAEVERLLDGNVSFYSVTDYLHARSRGVKPLFSRPQYGHYLLMR